MANHIRHEEHLRKLIKEAVHEYMDEVHERQLNQVMTVEEMKRCVEMEKAIFRQCNIPEADIPMTAMEQLMEGYK